MVTNSKYTHIVTDKKNMETGVLIIYTGGTIGSIRKHKTDILSPLVPGDIDDLINYIPNYDKIDSKILIRDLLIRINFVSFNNPIDSCNITPQDWLAISEIIFSNYMNYEGFVVLHGTDTLAYSASALSFLLEDLSKPVIVTGSQKPISETRTDAIQNLISSIEIAAAKSLGKPVIPEVCIMFRDKLLRGCRTTKISASRFAGFASPNFPELAEIAEHVDIRTKIIRSTSNRYLQRKTNFNDSIVFIIIFPGINSQIFKGIISDDSIKGIILKTYGNGNSPSNHEFLHQIESLVSRNKIVVNTTQCLSGKVEQGFYDVSSGLLSRGVITGMDLTGEAAYAKLGVLLSEEMDIGIIKDKFTINYRGEQKYSLFNLHFSKNKIDSDYTISVNNIRQMVEYDLFKPRETKISLLRFINLKIDGYKRGIIRLAVFFDYPKANENDIDKSDYYLGIIETEYYAEDGPKNYTIEITDSILKLFNPKRDATLTIINLTGYEIEWEGLRIEFYCE